LRIRSVREADVAGKRVFVRVDFNVPMEHGAITDDTRIRAALPTIEHLIERNARLILCSHLGRPKGKVVEELRMGPVADRLSTLLDRAVRTATAVVGDDARSATATLGDGDVLILENVRFEPGEEKNDPDLARQLASLAEIYVDDAFGAAHRAHASTAGIAQFLPAYSGLLMDSEISALSRLLDRPEKPFITILGGAKVSDKLGVIENLIPRVDALLIGGGMANTFLLALGREVGISLAEVDQAEKAAELVERAKAQNVDLLLPEDVVVARDLESAPSVVDATAVLANQSIYDIGSATAARFTSVIRDSRTIFWNGPMGVFERQGFASGTKAVAVAVAESNAFSVVGGGDSIAAVEQLNLADRISHISTGGGASLEFVEGRTLPGIAALKVAT
jgi:phosphoglycerate kinase